MTRKIKIRVAALDDAARLLAIYAYYTEHTAISFEYSPPSIEEFRSRMEKIMTRYPYFVAEDDGNILGYACTHQFIGRAAYDWSAETTIYIAKDSRKRGIGFRLYGAIENISREQGITNLYACIGYPDEEDEYLTMNSADFHAHMGYKLTGKFNKCGYKFGRWYSMAWMEKIIKKHEESTAPITAFPDIDKETLKRCGIDIIE
ncbi:MAG: GNAT family N-acetyltransferase [Schwartzia sp.]|nr:GNAT family N-acetyltransferase [Schwartzia sp. (in: firmicutes)]